VTLIIAGTTAYDQNDAALSAILAEWTSSRRYAERVENLRSGQGPILNRTGIKLREGTTVVDDDEVDQLFGGGGSDWLLYDLANDQVQGKKPHEAVKLTTVDAFMGIVHFPR